MKQKNFLKNVFAIIILLTSTVNWSQTTIVSEDFETDGGGIRYTISNEFNDGSSDHFGRTDGSNVSGGYSGQNGSFFIAGEDLDDNGGDGSSEKTILLDVINIAGYSDLKIKVLAAAGSAAAAGWDDTDLLKIEYSTDGTNFLTGLQFSAPSSGSNQGINFDTNNDGTGDGSALTNVFAEFQQNIPITGSTLYLRLYAKANSGSEEFAIDNIRLEGTAPTTPTIGFDEATSTENETDATFSVDVPVTVSNHDGNQIDLSVAVTGGNAEVADYTLNTTTLSFTGDGTQNVSIDIVPDTEDFDDETIILTLTETSSVTGLVISESTHTITVSDDETAPSVGFGSATSTENETNATFTSSNIPISVSNYSGTQIDVNVSVTGGTAETEDYTFTSPTSLSYTADGTQNITVDINDDADTDNETIIFTITETSSVTGLIISEATHTLTIDDDEVPPVPTAGTVFITEVSNDKGGDFNSEFIELFNNSNQTISLATSKLIRTNDSNTSEYVYDFGSDESTTDVELTIPPYGFIIITRGATKAEFNLDQGSTLPANVKYNGGNSQLYFGSNSRRWRLMTGGSANTDNGTLIDDTGAATGVTRIYRNIFTSTNVNEDDENGTPGSLEYLVYNGGAWVNSEAMNGTTSASDAYIYGDLTLSSNSAINDIGVDSGGSLIINSGTSLIVNGTSSGNVTYNRNLGTENWYLVSSPVAGETYDDAYVSTNSLAISGSNNAISTYVSASNSWSYMQTADAAANFTAGQGYSVRLATGQSTGDISFTGTINTTSVETSSLSVGYHLLGNPFTSYVNSATFLGAGTSSNLDQTQIWLWNQATGMYEVKTAGDAWVLAPGQGFFVNATSAGTVTFDESNQAATGNAFQKSEKTELKLVLSDGENNRFAKLNFDDNFNKGFDFGWEGETFGGIPNSLSIFTSLLDDNVGKRYQVQSLPNSDYESMIIPVGITANAGKEITFSAEALNLPTGIKVFLEDRVKNTFTRLDEANATYKVTLDEKLDGVGRFYVHTTQSALSIDKVTLTGVSIFKANAATLRVTGLQQGKASLSLFNVLGKQVMSTSFEATASKDISLPKLATGIYFAQVQTAAGKLSKKIIIE